MIYLLSIVLIFIGTIAVARDAFKGIRNSIDQSSLERELNSLRQHVDYIKSTNNSLPMPPYNKEQINKLNKEIEAKYTDDIKTLETKLGQSKINHSGKNFMWAIIGIIFFLIGSGLQINESFKSNKEIEILKNDLKKIKSELKIE